MADLSTQSILTTIKKLLGPEEDNTSFDQDIVMDINLALWRLEQLGVGTSSFSIFDKTAVWSDYLGTSEDLESAKTYVYLKTKMLFDPPTTAALIDAINRQIVELEWELESQIHLATIPDT